MTLLATMLEFSRCRPPDIESAPVKLVYLALGYAAAMGVANLIFSLGAVVESRLPAAHVGGFRRWAFGLLFGISVALPLAAPWVFLARCP